MYTQSDTIAAISTPAGKGGIAVIRLSGEEAVVIASKIFTAKSARKLTDIHSHQLVFGEIQDADGRKIDEVVISLFKAPHSFTGENTVEISCHGSVYIQQKILELLISNGARMATAGEFTQRAFLNGKMDLTQAEAVADLIASENSAAHKVALQQLKGGFSEELQKLRGQLLHFVSLIELELDFSEEDVEFANRSQLKTVLRELQTVIGKLIQSFALGNVIKNGVPVAIVGQTNVGKSTLLNALLGEERAIVSDIHGTTRDTIEDTIRLNGIAFRFIDTAGIRNTSETIEQLGIARTYDKIRKAAIVLLLLDASQPETIDSLTAVREHLTASQPLIIAVNKVDLLSSSEYGSAAPYAALVQASAHNPIVYLSAKNKTGIDTLTETLIKSVNLSPLSENETIVTNVRHYEALQHTQDALRRVEQGFENNLPGDLIAQDIREASFHLGSITGEIATGEILETIFGAFCIGK